MGDNGGGVVNEGNAITPRKLKLYRLAELSFLLMALLAEY